MNVDRIRRAALGSDAWQYSCSCGYQTGSVTRSRAELVQRIHRHRHANGRVGQTHHI